MLDLLRMFVIITRIKPLKKQRLINQHAPAHAQDGPFQPIFFAMKQ